MEETFKERLLDLTAMAANVLDHRDEDGNPVTREEVLEAGASAGPQVQQDRTGAAVRRAVALQIPRARV